MILSVWNSLMDLRSIEQKTSIVKNEVNELINLIKYLRSCFVQPIVFFIISQAVFIIFFILFANFFEFIIFFSAWNIKVIASSHDEAETFFIQGSSFRIRIIHRSFYKFVFI